MIVPKTTTSVQFHPSVTEVGVGYGNPFNKCRNSLRRVTFNEGLQKIRNSLFCGCYNLESITIPSTATIIEGYAFKGCRNLKEAVLNEGLKTIQAYAFETCTSLKSIELPSTLTEIGNKAFKHCRKLRVISIRNESINENQIIKQVIRAISMTPSDIKLYFPGIATRLKNIIKTDHWPDIDAKLVAIRLVGSLGSGNVFVNTRDGGSLIHWDTVEQSVDRLISWIRYYETEATTTLEFSLWKAKIDEVDDNTNAANREACRIEVPGPVKDTILQYL